MADKKLNVDDKKEIIVKFLRENKDTGYSQGDLARILRSELGYETEISTRVSIGKLLMELHESGIARFREEKPVRGYILKKVWYVSEA